MYILRVFYFLIISIWPDSLAVSLLHLALSYLLRDQVGPLVLRMRDKDRKVWVRVQELF